MIAADSPCILDLEIAPISKDTAENTRIKNILTNKNT